MSMILELQKAVFSRLNGDATLGARIEGVYDFVPQSAEFPYITIGNIAAKDWSTIFIPGIEATQVIEVYSRERGRKECHDIMERIRTLLHNASFTVTGHTLVDSYYTASQVIQQRDGFTFKGTITFKAHVRE